MFGPLRTFYRRHARRFTVGYLLAVLMAWLFGPVLLNILSLSESFFASFGILLLSLSAIHDYLDDLSQPPRIHISPDQAESNEFTIRWTETHPVGCVRMIEYDAESTKPLIFHFLRMGAHVHCLLQHPDSAINEVQRIRTVQQILTAKDEYEAYWSRVHFSYYRTRATVRGRLIDDKWLSVGWYTYDHRTEQPASQVWGHNNPVLLVDLGAPRGEVLRDWFEALFSRLQKDAEPWEALASRYHLIVTMVEREESQQTS